MNPKQYDRPLSSSCPRTGDKRMIQPVQQNIRGSKPPLMNPPPNPIPNPNHNLNINTYSLNEILNMFDLSHQISVEDMKRAKKKVLQLHPDKSKLPKEYFLFYKKAFDIVYQFYENQHKQSAKVEAKVYESTNESNEMFQQVNNVIQDLGERGFQSKFNELFEKNMARPTNPEKNAWFANDEPTYVIDGKVNTKNMGEMLESIKQKNQGLVKYTGVQTLYAGGQPGPGAGIYDEDENGPSDEYVSCDPFSKLKYDDLRKVHKDQTVFSISESDYGKIPKYASVDQYNRARTEQEGKPMERTEAETILANREREMQEKMMQKQYQSNLKTMEYEQKNKDVMASFLFLKNGKN
jgi:hypothetical protein